MKPATKFSAIKNVEEVFASALEYGRKNADRIGSVGGCGRVYVELISEEKTIPIAVRKKIEKCFKMTPRPYHRGKNRLYIGYDNASGFQWNLGEKVAEYLNKNGISCYVDGDGD